MTTPQHLSDRYELGEILGFGGMSEVHLARDVRLHRDVAVKVLRADLARDPSFYLRFRREAQNAAALNHPAIVAVYDTGEAETANGPLPYIVMEYVDGITLRDIVHTEGPMEPRRAIEVIADACQALNFSHQHGTIHRDVKPANIMISKSGAVKVMDFGIAKALADAGQSVTQTAAVIGTAQYLSPEQARGEKVDARSDVYSLGCVLYELLTGEPPFVGDSPVAVAYQHVREDPIPPSQRHAGISPELDAVVLKALTKNPDNRYQTAAEMRADLIRVHSGEAPEAPKVFTDAERTSMLTAPAPSGRNQPTEHIPAQRRGYTEPSRRNSVRLWVTIVAILAVLTVVVTIAINSIGDSPRDQQVPNVSNQSLDDARATLQNRGFQVDERQEDSSTVLPGVVIQTDPEAGTAVAAGDQITIVVSSGPKQEVVPDVRTMTPDQAEQRLRGAGFENVRRSPSASLPEQRDRVIDSVPPANSTSPITNPVTIVVGTGPGTRSLPDCVGFSFEDCDRLVKQSGFPNTIRLDVDSTDPSGQVIGTDPAAAAEVPTETLIQIRVSRGNQFVMPSLRGQFWDAAEPLLRNSYRWQGELIKLPNAQNSGVPTNGIVDQSPAPGTPLKFSDPITLSFAQ
ncbi:Stk1 family PASTA domain-containing Ser/Thr kinase [Mycolicibacterium sp. GCM10028919]|uniref:Stk1 family PASTA domain-containing Ser/Thr kinase n=1 Tax=Mycolicibacterium sp. GCM10028919 TaxID=3273401 RepID=UPI0036061BA0